MKNYQEVSLKIQTDKFFIIFMFFIPFSIDPILIDDIR